MTVLPEFLKTWNHSGINQRIPYLSVNDASASLLFGIKDKLVGTLGAPVLASCNGVTGPSTASTLLSAGDHTDRTLTKADCTTKATIAGAAQSWFAITWAGATLLFRFMGATDDIFQISFSPGNLFISAATTTHAPTATDECIIATGLSMVAVTASADRVFSIQATTDRSVFRCWVFRQTVLTSSFGLEKIVEAPNVAAGTVIGWNSTLTSLNLAQAGSHGGIMNNSAIGANGAAVAYLNGAPRLLCGGTVVFNYSNATTIFASPSELNGGAPIWPLLIGCSVTANTGWLGTRYDGFWSTGTIASPIGTVSDDVDAGTRVIWAGSMQTPWPTDEGIVTS